MILTIDGTPIRLPPVVAGMVLALVRNSESIARQGYGCVLLDYCPKKAAMKLLKKNYDAEISVVDLDKPLKTFT